VCALNEAGTMQLRIPCCSIELFGYIDYITEFMLITFNSSLDIMMK